MKMENNQLPSLTFEQAKRAKNVGFDWPTNELITPDNKVWSPENIHKAHSGDYGFGTFIKCPENALFLQWAREVRGIANAVSLDIHEDEPHLFFKGYKWQYYVMASDFIVSVKEASHFETYPQAETALIYEILNILEKQ
jgi:hypothetical protein